MQTERATMLISSGKGPEECRRAVALFLDKIRVHKKHLDMDVTIRGDEDAPKSAIVVLTGDGASAYAKHLKGGILWYNQSDKRSRSSRKNWFIGAFVIPEPSESAAVPAGEIEMTAIRAGGPGGQHQNKTSSAIRARWVAPSGKAYAVVVREDRSQHMNRRLAAERIAALVSADATEEAASRSSATHALHTQVQRGDPKWVFSGSDFREMP